MLKQSFAAGMALQLTNLDWGEDAGVLFGVAYCSSVL